MKFKVGDRVAVYDGDRIVGVIGAIHKEGGLLVCLDEAYGGAKSYHPKQCRRLVKKQRRRVWLSRGAAAELHGGISAEFFAQKRNEDDVEFVEVRKKR